MANGGWIIVLVIIALAVLSGFLVSSYQAITKEQVDHLTLINELANQLGTAEAISTAVAQGTKVAPINATPGVLATKVFEVQNTKKNKLGVLAILEILGIAIVIAIISITFIVITFIKDPPYPKSLDINIKPFKSPSR